MNCLSAVLVVLVLFCTATDLLYGKIYNGIVFPCLFAGVFLRLLQGGLQELPGILASVLIPFLMLYPFWLITGGNGLGGGDIKLLTAVSACLSLSVMLTVSLVSFGTALVFGLSKIVYERIQHGRLCTDGENSMNRQPVVQESSGIHLAFFVALGVLLHIGGVY